MDTALASPQLPVLFTSASNSLAPHDSYDQVFVVFFLTGPVCFLFFFFNLGLYQVLGETPWISVEAYGI